VIRAFFLLATFRHLAEQVLAWPLQAPPQTLHTPAAGAPILGLG
jgi:hypothetical protein